MLAYKSHREAKRATGGAAKPPHGMIGLVIIHAVPTSEKKKTEGGSADGAAAKPHLGKRARGGKLTAKARRNMPSSEFALPGKGSGQGGKGTGSYPVEDRAHARSALARAAQHASPDERAKIRAAVHRRYPDIQES